MPRGAIHESPRPDSPAWVSHHRRLVACRRDKPQFERVGDGLGRRALHVFEVRASEGLDLLGQLGGRPVNTGVKGYGHGIETVPLSAVELFAWGG